MNKWEITSIVLGTVIISFVSLAIVGVLVTNQESNANVPASLVQSDVQLSSKEVLFKSNFMDSCVEAGASAGSCACMYDYLLDNFGFSEMVKMDDAARSSDELDNRVLEAALSCLEE